MKVLIDCDVCLDLLTGRQPYVHAAKKLFADVESTNLEAIVSPDSFSNIFYILKGYHESPKIILKLKKLRRLVIVVSLTQKHIDGALNSDWNDIEDAMQYFCARDADCNGIINRNTDDFSLSSLSVFTPSDFLNR